MKMLKTAQFHLSGIGAALLLAVSPQVFAHAHLTDQTPAAKSQVSAPSELTFVFSEGIETGFSKVTVVGPENQPIATGKLSVAGNDKTHVSVPFTQHLNKGEYAVSWNVVSVDGHKTKGQYTFSVK